MELHQPSLPLPIRGSEAPFARRLAARIRRFPLDRALAAGEDPRSDALLACRAEQLRSAPMRRHLAADLRDLVKQADHRSLLERRGPHRCRRASRTRPPVGPRRSDRERRGRPAARRRDDQADARRWRLAALRVEQGRGSRGRGRDGDRGSGEVATGRTLPQTPPADTAGAGRRAVAHRSSPGARLVPQPAARRRARRGRRPGERPGAGLPRDEADLAQVPEAARRRPAGSGRARRASSKGRAPRRRSRSPAFASSARRLLELADRLDGDADAGVPGPRRPQPAAHRRGLAAVDAELAQGSSTTRSRPALIGLGG